MVIISLVKKKIIAINTDFLLAKTGLGRNGREIAEYLFKTGKYEIVYYACGYPWRSPEYDRFPFKVFGTVPEDQRIIQEIGNDPLKQRDMAYGSYSIERLVNEVKPDILLLSNDSWSFMPYLDKPFWNKIHCVCHITLDSLPFMPDQKRLIENSKYFFVWADFAEKEAHRLGYKHVKTLTGIIRPDHFFKLPRSKKIELRRRFNIPDNAFIAGYVFRNQLRKEIGPTLEGYALFKKQSPEIKNTYFLCHTHWSEPSGWDIHRLCEEYGIDKKEILTTYICRQCKEIDVRPFTGQDQDCRFCGIKGSNQGTGLVTCNVGFGCTEEQLNEVYNLMDCYCHCANASGLEMPKCEALYCELPLGTVDYAAGSMFTAQKFVTSIDFSWSLQLGTQFKRATPYPSSIAKFFRKIAFMPIEDREKIGKQGREWALSKFSPAVVGQQWEQFFDSLPEHGWDFCPPKPVIKDPNAIIPANENNKQWIKSLYNLILKVEPDENGWNYWVNLLQQGTTRQQIEQQFRMIAQGDNQKLQPNPIQTIESFFTNDPKKKLLLVCKESIGDIILTTALLSSFREKYPKEEWSIYFACDPQYHEILDGNENIDKVIPYHPIFESELQCTGAGAHKGFVDAYSFIPVGTQRFLNYLTNHNLNLELEYK